MTDASPIDATNLAGSLRKALSTRVVTILGRGRDADLIGFQPSEVRTIIAALEQAASFWRCGSGHVVYVEPGTPPYEAGPCPLCEAAADRESMQQAVALCDRNRPTMAAAILRAALEGKP